MKQTLKLFQIGLRQVRKDGMLLVLLPLPFLVGLIFKFAIPYANKILEDNHVFSLLPWYGLVDGMLLCLTPMFVAIVFAFLMLEERDEGITAFYQVTPAGGYSYLAARVGIPIAGSLIITIISVFIFNISGLSWPIILSGSILSALTGTSLAMMVVSIANNRVEGIAVSKLMGISFLGLILVWFVPDPLSYFCAFLPSFWIGKLMIDGMNPMALLLGLVTCCIWITLFSRRFLIRIG